jgi:hypothetical protein
VLSDDAEGMRESSLLNQLPVRIEDRKQTGHGMARPTRDAEKVAHRKRSADAVNQTPGVPATFAAAPSVVCAR